MCSSDLGTVLGNLGILHLEQGRPAEAGEHYEAALDIHREVGARRSEGIVLGNLGNLHLDQGRPAEAREHHEAALAIHREVGNRRFEGVVLGNLGILHQGQGRPAEAREHCEAALDIQREVGDRRTEGNVLGSLGFTSRSLAMRLHDIGPEQAPCLFLPDGRDAMVLVGMMLERTGDQGEQFVLETFDSARGHYIDTPEQNLKGTAYIFRRFSVGPTIKGRAVTDWLRAVGQRFRSLAWQALGLTLGLNLLGLAVPLFVMAVFDNAIASGSAQGLTYLALGVGIAVIAEIILRSLRAGLFSFVGARLDNIVGVEVFRKILYLPASLIERAAIGAQVSRIRDFESGREFLTG